jgi:hypothetical protein
LIRVDSSNVAGVWNIVSYFDQIEALQSLSERLFKEKIPRERFAHVSVSVRHLREAFRLGSEKH